MEDNKSYYLKAEKRLYAKKENLFLNSDSSKWDLAPEDVLEKYDLIKDKEVMIPKMLPKVIRFKTSYNTYNTYNNKY